MGTLQRSLFPHLEECYAKPLTDKERQLVSILEIVEIEKQVYHKASNQWMGKRLREREAIARAFVAKAVYNHPFTRTTLEALKTAPTLRRLCGFERVSDIPSESTFSRAFAEFARSGLGDRVHEALVGKKEGSSLLLAFLHSHCELFELNAHRMLSLAARLYPFRCAVH